ncbi:MAG: hypothetical protein IPK16_26680 [Anaerolineales bacterium]|nr:hypothetical protein [Anaerolineales bacterium]
MVEEPTSILAFARLVIDALEAAQIDYLLDGALALIAWGEPRTTENCDFVIHLIDQRIRQLSIELDKRRMPVPPDILLDLLIVLEPDLPVNLIHLDSGYKAQLLLLRPNDLFRASSLARKRLVDLGEPLGAVFVHAPEDLMLNKILYYGLSQQTKHVRDIASIVAVSRDEIDWGYFDQWISRLNLESIWAEMKLEVDRLLGC